MSPSNGERRGSSGRAVPRAPRGEDGTMISSLTRDSRTRGALAFGGAGLIVAAGLIHLVLTPEHIEEAAYLGLLFLADFAGSLVAVAGILRGQRWGWALGAFVAGGAFVAYLVDGTVGLPGMEAGGLLEPAGVLVKALEALFLVLCAFELVAGFGRRALAMGVAAVLATAGLAVALILLGVASGDETRHESPPSQHHDE